MPLRDHFHPPLKDRRPWESWHSLWPGLLVQRLSERLPRRYYAVPQTHLGIQVEADVATFEEEQPAPVAGPPTGDGIATAVWAPPRPTQTFATNLPAQDTFEVRVHDEDRGSRLVAVVELVSPRNKDRPEAREAFVRKCATYLQERVGLVVVDVVTERHHNLHRALMQLLGLTETSPLPGEASLYAVAYRFSKENEQWHLATWNERLTVGESLPTLPLWLASDLAVPLELEASYEEACRVLRI